MTPGSVAPVAVQLVSKPGSRSTGIGRYAHELESGLRAAGLEFTLADVRNPIPKPVTSLVRKFGYDLTAFTNSYPVRARAEPGRLTHITSQTLATLLLTQRLPRPVVVTVHDILPYILRDDPNLSVYRRRLDRLTDSLAMRGLRRADRLIADSAYTKQTLIDVLRVPENRIDVVHLGINADTFRPMAVNQDFFNRYTLSQTTRYILFVGSEDPRKDLPTLLRAMAIVRHHQPDIELIKVGAPAFVDQRRKHLELSQQLGLGNAIHWIDAVPEDDLPRFYNIASAFVFPSRYEGFGFPVLEAMACGTPVVAVAASSVPELVGVMAAPVPPANPEAMAEATLTALANGHVDRNALVRHAGAFSWPRTVAATIDVYARALVDYRARQ